MKIRSMFTVGFVALAASVAAVGCGDDDNPETTAATGATASTAATGETAVTGETAATSETAATGETAETDSSTESSGGDVSTIKISADPNGQLRYEPVKIVTKPGENKLVFTNDSNVPHDVIIGKGFKPSGRVAGTRRIVNSRVTKTINLNPGAYSFYCDVPGHQEGGMVGALIVR